MRICGAQYRSGAVSHPEDIATGVILLNRKEYSELVERKSPSSKLFKNCVNAFLVGGAICTVGQMFFNIYTGMGLGVEAAGSLVSVTLVLISAILTGFGVYDSIAKYAGAGTVVPITGFANSVVSPAIEAKTEGYVLGVGAKIFTIAGPVLVYGTASSFVAGIVYWVMSMM